MVIGSRVGLAVIGCGRIGSLRARLAAEHPATEVVAVADTDIAAAESLAGKTGAALATSDTAEAIAHADVTAVVVATPEGSHTAAALDAIAQDRRVLVEKPIALDLGEADEIVAAAAGREAEVYVGYSRRYRRRYATAMEQVRQGRLGTILGGAARVYNSRTQAMAMLDRNPQATPVLDALTYYVDLMQWYLADRRLVEATGIAQRGVLAAAGYDADDITWATLRYDDGAAVSLGVSYALPSEFPVRGHAARVELIGTDGVILIDDDHADQIMHTTSGVSHVYLDDEPVNTVFLSSGTPGDWALGGFVGPLAAETRAWLDHVSTGRPCHLATAGEARATLATTLAIEDAVQKTRLP